METTYITLQIDYSFDPSKTDGEKARDTAVNKVMGDALAHTHTIEDGVRIDAIKEETGYGILSLIRRFAAARIRRILAEAGLDFVRASEIDGTSSPVVEQDFLDGNNTKTLDSIRIVGSGLVFSASSCWDNAEYDENNIPTDALLYIAVWIEEHKDNIEEEKEE